MRNKRRKSEEGKNRKGKDIDRGQVVLLVRRDRGCERWERKEKWRRGKKRRWGKKEEGNRRRGNAESRRRGGREEGEGEENGKRVRKREEGKEVKGGRENIFHAVAWHYGTWRN